MHEQLIDIFESQKPMPAYHSTDSISEIKVTDAGNRFEQLPSNNKSKS